MGYSAVGNGRRAVAGAGECRPISPFYTLGRLAVGRVVFREICDSCTLAGVVFDAHVGGVRILTNGCIGLVWGAGGILWRESPLSAQATLIIVDILTKLTNGLGWGSVPIFHESYRLDGGETAPCRHPGGTSPASCRNHAGVTLERRWNVTGTARSGSPDCRVRTGADDRQTNQGKPRSGGQRWANMNTPFGMRWLRR
jgi:hypothetical protein